MCFYHHTSTAAARISPQAIPARIAHSSAWSSSGQPTQIEQDEAMQVAAGGSQVTTWLTACIGAREPGRFLLNHIYVVDLSGQ
jgi:hypothetical protein